MHSATINDLLSGRLVQKGVDLDYIAGRIKEQIECMHVNNPKHPDNFNRNRALEMAVKIVGGFPPKQIDIKSQGMVTLDLSPELKDRAIQRKGEVDEFIDAEIIEDKKKAEDDIDRPF